MNDGSLCNAGDHRSSLQVLRQSVLLLATYNDRIVGTWAGRSQCMPTGANPCGRKAKEPPAYTVVEPDDFTTCALRNPQHDKAANECMPHTVVLTDTIVTMTMTPYSNGKVGHLYRISAY